MTSLHVASAKIRNARHWKREKVSWNTLTGWAESPVTVTDKAHAPSVVFAHLDKDDDCDRPGCNGVHRLKLRVRTASPVIPLDAEGAAFTPTVAAAMLGRLDALGYAAVVHPTLSSTDGAPRWRVLVQADREHTIDERWTVAHHLMDLLDPDGLGIWDRKAAEAERYFVRPAVLAEQADGWWSKVLTGQPVSVDDVVTTVGLRERRASTGSDARDLDGLAAWATEQRATLEDPPRVPQEVVRGLVRQGVRDLYLLTTLGEGEDVAEGNGALTGHGWDAATYRIAWQFGQAVFHGYPLADAWQEYSDACPRDDAYDDAKVWHQFRSGFQAKNGFGYAIPDSEYDRLDRAGSTAADDFDAVPDEPVTYGGEPTEAMIQRALARLEHERLQREALLVARRLHAEALAESEESRYVTGAAFLFDQPEGFDLLWGTQDEPVWAKGEACMLAGPPGVGKTTVAGQIVRALTGLESDALGWPVVQAKKVLYLAMDRPRQTARALRRHFRPDEREHVAERLIVWPGPPQSDFGQDPEVLLRMAHEAGADVVVIDSVKDTVANVSEEAGANGYNKARQTALAAGIDVLELHHLVKSSDGSSKKPATWSAIYGGMPLVAGVGSLVLLWGNPGDRHVEMHHLKPIGEPFQRRTLEHDHVAGVTTVVTGRAAGDFTADVIEYLDEQGVPVDQGINKTWAALQGHASNQGWTRAIVTEAVKRRKSQAAELVDDFIGGES